MSHIEAYPLEVELLEAILDDLPIGALILEDDGTIRRFNRHEEQLSGLSREETIGKSFFSDVAPCTKDIELGPKFHRGIEHNDLDLSVEFSFPFPYNRVPRDVFIRAKSVESPGGEIAHVVLIEDVTSRKQLERNNAEIMTGLRAMLKRKGVGAEAQLRHKAPGFTDEDGEAVSQEAYVLHADLVGFRHVAAKLNPGDLFPVLDKRLREAVDIVHRHGGRIDQIQGDSIAAYFLPKDDGKRTVLDAARAAAKVARSGMDSEIKLPFRVGLAHGHVLNGLIGRKEFGERVTVGKPLIVSRLMTQIARAHELVISGEVCERLGDAVGVTPMQGSLGSDDLGELFRVEKLSLPDTV